MAGSHDAWFLWQPDALALACVWEEEVSEEGMEEEEEEEVGESWSKASLCLDGTFKTI